MMTAIRVDTPPEDEDETERLLRPQTSVSSNASSIQLEGVVADNSMGRANHSRTEIGGIPAPYHPSGRINASDQEGRERAASRTSMPASWKSEPDLDTIMPLPGGLGRPTALGVYGEGEEDGDSPSFTNVEHHTHYGDDLTSSALQTCKKTVLNPYLLFLKMIGWRRFNPRQYDLRTPAWLSLANVLWPTFVCLLLVFSCITQIFTCFRRDHVALYPLKNGSENVSYYKITCEDHILTIFIIPDVLLIFSFAYGLYIFRWIHTEQLATLTEAVFLGHITKYGKYTHRRLTTTLQLVILLGVVWIVFSLVCSIGRTYTEHLVDRNTIIQWLSGTQGADLALRWVFVTITIAGFVLLDIAYMAVVVNYSIQCQLLVYLVRSIGERTRFKEWGLDQAIKEIRNSREFLSQLNSHLSRAISVLIFIFLTSSVSAVYGVYQVKKVGSSAHLVSLFGILAVVQWLTVLVLPLVQAARVTRACSSLKKVATEIRSRPYSYKNSAQLDLDSMVIYTSSLNMSAKLVSIPITPSLVAGLLFFGGLVLFMVFQYGQFSWAKWL